MSFYSIAQLEKLSGVKAHTIRIWEQRYNLLTPERTGTNIRLYNDAELKKLLNTSLLINKGYKISKISSFSDNEINEIINDIILNLKAADLFSEGIINKLISTGLAYNEADFTIAFSSAVLRLGLNETYEKILYPLMVRMGLMWTCDGMNPCQEHFITNLIKQKLFAAIDNLPLPVTSKRKWILFLPEEEDHEIGLLFAYFILKQAGYAVVYMGQRVPYENLKEATYQNNPSNLLFFLVRHQPGKTINSLIKNIQKDFKGLDIIISGNSEILSNIKKSEYIHKMNSVDEFKKYINK